MIRFHVGIPQALMSRIRTELVENEVSELIKLAKAVNMPLPETMERLNAIRCPTVTDSVLKEKAKETKIAKWLADMNLDYSLEIEEIEIPGSNVFLGGRLMKRPACTKNVFAYCFESSKNAAWFKLTWHTDLIT